MTAIDCILRKMDELAAAGSKSAAAIKGEIEEAVTQAKLDGQGDLDLKGGSVKAAEISERALTIFKRKSELARRRDLLQIAVNREIAARFAEAGNKFVPSLLKGISFITFDATGRAGGLNAEFVARGTAARAFSLGTDFLEKFRDKLPGREINFRDVTSDLMGIPSGNKEAKAFADGLRESMEFLRNEFNRLGGNLRKIDGFIPQQHDPVLMLRGSRADWIAYTRARLDRSKMISYATDEPMSDTQLDTMLSSVYDEITTPTVSGKMGILGRRDSDRVLYYKDADTYAEYMNEYGPAGADLFLIYTGYVQNMSRDIGMLRVLGARPEQTLNLIENLTKKGMAEEAAALRRGEGKGAFKKWRADYLARRALNSTDITSIRDTFAVVAGTSDIPERLFISNMGATARNLMTAASLGSSFFSAITDLTFSSVASMMSGLPAAKIMAKHVALFAKGPAGRERKATAVRSAYVTGVWTSVAGSQARFIGEVMGPKWSRWLADRTLRAAFLTPWTEAGRVTFGLEFAGYLTQLRAKGFKGLDKGVQRVMNSHGISAGDWDIYRNTPIWRDPETRAEFIRPQDVAKGAEGPDAGLLSNAEKISHKFQSMVMIETDFAIPTINSRVRALLGRAQRPGTLMGELLRAGTLFKSFPVTMMHTNLRRMWYADMSRLSKAQLFAYLGIGATFMGMLGEQMFQISRGKDPKNMDVTTTEGLRAWRDAFWRGGALGFFGDVMFADQNRLGMGLLETVAGPILTTGNKLVRLTVGNIQQAAEGADTNLGRELGKFIQNITPGRSLWFGALAFERLMMDTIARQLDPDADRRFADIVRRTKRETGQDYFAPPGRGVQRRPRLGTAFE